MGTEGNSMGEYNPFEMSLGTNGGDKTRRSSFSTLLEAPTEAQPHSTNSGFDLLSNDNLSNGRKRALSSPAVATPGGSSFPFLLSSSQTTRIPSGAMPNLAIKPSKRPRMSVVSSGSGLSDFRIPSAGHSDASPESSDQVPTPPDSYHPGVPSNDIDVNGANGNIFSKLQQQRQLLLSGQAQPSLSQPPPLPLGPLPTNNQGHSDQSTTTTVPTMTMPPLTRSASKKGRAPARASPAPSSASASPAPQAKPKRAAGGRKKNGTLSKKQQQAAEQQAQQEQQDEEDGDLSEDSLKRKQFLERNRVAACKSRQKKKEKVGKLEQGEFRWLDHTFGMKNLRFVIFSQMRLISARRINSFKLQLSHSDKRSSLFDKSFKLTTDVLANTLKGTCNGTRKVEVSHYSTTSQDERCTSTTL
jgi:hypothetical protein